jgi:oxaloacetate decarboxylase alpha subunit
LVTGRYGALAAPANPDLVKKALEKNKYDAVLTERPADKIPNEFDKIEAEAKAAGAVSVEDALTFAMFPKVAPDFFKNRAKGPVDSASFAVKPAAAPADSGKGGGGSAGSYVVNVNGADYHVTVRPSGTLAIAPAPAGGASAPVTSTPPAAPVGSAQIPAPVAGTVLRYAVDEGSDVKTGDTVIIIESMKMELEIKTTVAGKIHFLVPAGAQVQSQQPVASVGGVAVAAPVQAAAPEAAAVPVVAPAPAALASTGGTVIPAPVAGTILRYAVDEGSAVKTSDTVIIIESMKMELEIKTTVAGSVHFLVTAGAQVASGQPIAEVK